MIFLGFDTSNYTTSVGAVSQKEITNIRSLLPVEEGCRGIRQSEGVFLHTKNIAGLYSRLDIPFSEVRAVGASTRPRNVEGSYMPVFLVGEAFARGVAHTLDVPFFEFSHQDGHIMAGIISCGEESLLEEEFISVHLSGGTTEILRTRFNGCGFDNIIIGGTSDISAGQFIDRTGVYLGMRFPCGKELEALAKTASCIVKLPISSKGAYMSFSGVETKVKGLVPDTDAAVLALSVLTNVRDTLIKSLSAAIDMTNIHKILVVGGVASNSLIRQGLKKALDAKVFFASPELSCDNGAGIAALTQKSFEGLQNGTKNSNSITNQ